MKLSEEVRQFVGDDSQDFTTWADRIEELEAENKRLLRLLSHVMYCDMPEELRFRCEQCTEAEKALRGGG